MAAGLKQAGADLAFKGGLHNGTRYLALFSAEGTELSGNGYARRPITLAQWDDDGAEQENANQVVWGPPQPAAWLAVTHWGLYSALTAGNLLYDVDITDTDPPGVGAEVAAAADTVGFSFTGLPSRGSLQMMKEGLVSGTRYLMLSNNSSPASSAGGGTSNIINTDGTVGGSGTPVAVAAVAGDWTLDNQNTTTRRARNNKILSFGIQSADLPDPVRLLLCDGNSHASNILWDVALTSDDPSLGDNLSFAVNAISILLTQTA